MDLSDFQMANTLGKRAIVEETNNIQIPDTEYKDVEAMYVTKAILSRTDETSSSSCPPQYSREEVA